MGSAWFHFRSNLNFPCYLTFVVRPHSTTMFHFRSNGVPPLASKFHLLDQLHSMPGRFHQMNPNQDMMMLVLTCSTMTNFGLAMLLMSHRKVLSISSNRRCSHPIFAPPNYRNPSMMMLLLVDGAHRGTGATSLKSCLSRTLFVSLHLRARRKLTRFL